VKQPYRLPWYPNAKLDPGKAEQIRAHLRGRGETYAQIGRRFNVGKSTICRIARGHAWTQQS
jgi:hypothetical protein